MNAFLAFDNIVENNMAKLKKIKYPKYYYES